MYKSWFAYDVDNGIVRVDVTKRAILEWLGSGKVRRMAVKGYVWTEDYESGMILRRSYIVGTKEMLEFHGCDMSRKANA